jgi:hypothetical protein
MQSTKSSASTSILHSFNCRAKLALAGAVLLATFGAANSGRAGDLVLWNTLGSDAEVLNSAYGPNLEKYSGGVWPDVTATPAYGPGVFGGALTIGPGSYSSEDRAHNIVFNNLNQYVNPNRGTIEMWYKQVSEPVGYVNGFYRLFDGAFGLGSGIEFDSSPDGLTFGLTFGGSETSASYNISPFDGTWIHVAGVWDRAGIGGSADTLRLYVNGNVVGASTTASWGDTVGSQADIGGAQDYNIADQFYLDNLQVWDNAQTDFSTRFQESPAPEPATLGLAGLGALVWAWRRHSAKSA